MRLVLIRFLNSFVIHDCFDVNLFIQRSRCLKRSFNPLNATGGDAPAASKGMTRIVMKKFQDSYDGLLGLLSLKRQLKMLSICCPNDTSGRHPI